MEDTNEIKAGLNRSMDDIDLGDRQDDQLEAIQNSAPPMTSRIEKEGYLTARETSAPTVESLKKDSHLVNLSSVVNKPQKKSFMKSI